MSVNSILESMREPWKLQSDDIVQGYMYLSSIHASKSLAWVEAYSKAMALESKHLQDGMTSAKAKTLAGASEDGRAAFKLKVELAAIQEAIRALKKAQDNFTNERGNFNR